GFDSLMYTELGVALEAAGVAVPEAADLTGIATVTDFERLVEAWGRRPSAPHSEKTHARAGHSPAPAAAGREAGEIPVPGPLVTVGNAVLNLGQRMTYWQLFRTRITGAGNIPPDGNFIVAANHSSHLDMGLVKMALGDWGPKLVALA